MIVAQMGIPKRTSWWIRVAFQALYVRIRIHKEPSCGSPKYIVTHHLPVLGLTAMLDDVARFSEMDDGVLGAIFREILCPTPWNS